MNMWAALVTIIVASIAVVVVAVGRSRFYSLRARIKLGKLGLEIEGDKAPSPGVEVRDAVSRKGGLKARDSTDGGAKVKRVDVAEDTEVSSVSPVAGWQRRAPIVILGTGAGPGAAKTLDHLTAGGQVIVPGNGRTIEVAARAVEPAERVGPLHQLPPPPGDFTGREEELQKLLQGVRQGGATVSSMRGMGGVGKTALALVLADRLKGEYPDAQVFLDLRGTSPHPLTAADALAHVIRTFNPESRLPEDQGQLAALFLDLLHDKRVLLLMDNAAGADQVRPLIPPEGSVLLVTSRQHFTLPGMVNERIDLLKPQEARELLMAIVDRLDRDQAGRIADLCGRLPLALRAAGSLLAVREDLSADDYIARLGDERTRLEAIGAEGVEAGVEAALDMSYVQLDAEAKRVFRECSVFSGSFDGPAAEIICRDAQCERMSSLVSHSLVEFDGQANRYPLHDLVRVFAGRKAGDDERLAAEQRHAEHYLKVLAAADDLYMEGGENVLAGLALFDGERGNIEAGQSWAARHAGESDAANSLCIAYPDAGAYCLPLRLPPREHIGWLAAAVEAARRSKDRRAEGMALGNLGNRYAALGKTRRAIELYEQRLEIARQIGDRRGEGNALGNLGNAYAALGETRRAIEHHEKALAIDRQIGDRRGEGQDLGNLGNAYAALGETRRAIEFHEKALAIDRQIGDKRGEGQDLGNLGNAYAALGDARRAIELCEQRLEIAREIGDRRGEGNALWNTTLSLALLGRREEAIRLAEEALKIFEQIEHPAVGKVRKRLAEWRGGPGH